jgi:hypothetical protein
MNSPTFLRCEVHVPLGDAVGLRRLDGGERDGAVAVAVAAPGPVVQLHGMVRSPRICSANLLAAFNGFFAGEKMRQRRAGDTHKLLLRRSARAL